MGENLSGIKNQNHQMMDKTWRNPLLGGDMASIWSDIASLTWISSDIPFTPISRVNVKA